MTHRPITVLPDGTRKYADGHRYKPMAAEDRTNAVRRPDDPRAVRFYGEWLLPIDTIAAEQRVMPETRPDDDAYLHAGKRGGCRCEPCRRPTAERYRRRWRREMGLAPGPATP